MTMFARGCLVLAVAWCSLGGIAAAAEPAAALGANRPKILFLTKGKPEIVNFGSLNDTASQDTYLVVLIGAGNVTLTVDDTDLVGEMTGDTIRVLGSLVSAFPTSFNEVATSPDPVVVPLPVSGVSLLTFSVRYDAIVNGSPANYLYRVEY